MSELEAINDHVSAEAADNIKKWLTQPKYLEYKDELIDLINQGRWQELEDAFFKTIEFGTGGRRGTTGLGSNRINKVTIGESAQALCIYAASIDPSAAKKGVVIAYDTRLTSSELSKFVARVCAANGFTTYLFDTFRSTPELSFAVRELGAAIGIVISASHNPPLDNGFKAYWSDGGQLVAPHDAGVMDVASDITAIESIAYEDALRAGQIKIINKDLDDAYIAAVLNEAEGTARDLHIVYSPLHGAGQTNTLPVLQAAGFTTISTVEDQMTPDGNFPTIENGKPNPEEKAANDRAVAQLVAEEADIAITNDPDADRIGVMVRQGKEVVYLNGNESAVLATEYSLRKQAAKGTLTPKHYIAKTIVTTDMMSSLATKYGVTMYSNLLIGFKYVGELIHSKEETDEVFVIGGEESYGLLKGSYARDKDGAVGALPLAEYAAELKAENKTLYDRLLELYSEHGLYLERLDSTYFTGAKGFEKMQSVMQDLRTSPPLSLGDHIITAVRDYKTLERRDVKTNQITQLDCVKGNVMVFEFDNDYRKRITIRPSGTEPKIKFYVQWFEEITSNNTIAIEAQKQTLNDHLTHLAKQLEGIVLE
jgi:phosphoglucomutase